MAGKLSVKWPKRNSRNWTKWTERKTNRLFVTVNVVDTRPGAIAPSMCPPVEMAGCCSNVRAVVVGARGPRVAATRFVVESTCPSTVEHQSIPTTGNLHKWVEQSPFWLHFGDSFAG